MTDLYDEAAMIAEMIDVTPKSRVKDVETAPRGFDPACMFLLRMNYANLFEPIGRQGIVFRCKGCRQEGIAMSARERHYKAHVRNVGRKGSGNGLAKSSELPYDRDTTSSGAQAPSPNNQGGTDNMATAPATTSKPTTAAKPAAEKKPGKTKIARAAAIDVLVKANRPMDMSEIVEKVMSRKAVIDADIPKGTVSAQINFELAEAKPKIVRFGRGVYGAVGVKAPTDTPAPATKRASTKKAATPAATAEEAPAAPAEAEADKPAESTGKSDPAAAAAASAEHNEVKPDPKPGGKK